MPPVMGAAIRLIISEPVPMDHIIGTNPRNIVTTVMNLGRMRMIAPRRSARLLGRPSFCLFARQVGIKEHEDTRFSVHAKQCDQTHPRADAHVVPEVSSL